SFDKRIFWIDSLTFRDFRKLYYDKSGRLVKIYNASFRRTPQLPERKYFGLSEDFHWIKNALTGHRTIVYHPPLCFNHPIPDDTYTFKWLERAH
ncbi:MAG: outer membrane lipoprotein-sorting protein, partial [Nitrospira sp.]|nr:outer membrane lipoprotein-sorting protein [Nitrospira sp.]